jgi:hypothetical protein
MKKTAITALRLAGAAWLTSAVWLTAAHASDYAGQETRAIATLSAQDVDDLLAGRGWGFALAAELNGYPGPLHVLELAGTLDLSEAQEAEVRDIFASMNARARTLGADYVAAEAALSAAFDAGELEPDALARLVSQSAQIEAELRRVHLEAHLATSPVLTRHQKVVYNRARGYDAGEGGHGQHGGHGHD